MEARLMNLTRPKKLKPTAIPSLKFNRSLTPQKLRQLESLRLARIKQRCARKELSLFSETDQEPSTSEQPVCDICRTVSIESLVTENSSLKEELASVNRKLKEALLELSDLKGTAERDRARFKKESEELAKANEVLTALFSKGQLDLLTRKKKKVWWESKDIKRAFSLRYLSKRAYLYVKNELKIPLPGISSLQRWASRINITQGVLKEIIDLMGIAAINFSTHQRLCVISFDEVKVSETVEKDVGRDVVLGPHSQMLVALVRGLVSDYKQVVYADFDTVLTPDVLSEIIRSLHEAGLTVVACVSDFNANNRKLLGLLAIDMTRPWFIHPCTGQKIYFFPDVYHLIKSIRLCLIERGFTLGDGSEVCRKPIEQLLELDSDELRATFKVTKNHLDCHGPMRGNVKLAMELLSRSTGTAVIRHSTDVDAEATGSFILKVNEWFDLMNSRVQRDTTIKSKWAYGMALPEQEAILNDFSNTIKSMRCGLKENTNKGMDIFQKAIIISCKSLKMLYNDLYQHFGVEFVLTSRLSKYVLENIFTRLTTLNDADQLPTPLSALERLRMPILGRNATNVPGNTNTPDDSEGDDLITQVFKKSNIKVPISEYTEEVMTSNKSSSPEEAPSPTEDCSEDSAVRPETDHTYIFPSILRVRLVEG